MADANRPVTLAAIAGAHGVRGEVRLKLFGEGAEALRAFSVFNAGERKLTLKSVRPANQGAVATFAEVTDRSGAEALRGTVLTVPRSALPPLGEGEYYHHDCSACRAYRPMVRPCEVVAIDNFGAGDILEIAKPTASASWCHDARAFPEWNIERVVVSAEFID